MTRDEYLDTAMHAYPLFDRIFYEVVVCIVWIFTKLYHRWTFEDEKILIEQVKQHPSIIIMNHESMLEPMVAVCCMWRHRVRLRLVYKSDFDENRLVSWFFRCMGGIPVKRHTADRACIKHVQRALQRGECVLIFPEGTRAKSDKDTTIYGGFAFIAELAKANIVPTAVMGARAITSPGKRIPRPCRVWFKAGRAIAFDEFAVKDRKQRRAMLEKKSWECVLDLRKELCDHHLAEKYRYLYSSGARFEARSGTSSEARPDASSTASPVVRLEADGADRDRICSGSS